MPALDPTLDEEWLARLDASPHDRALRAQYFAALTEAGDPRGELAAIEGEVAAMELAAAGRDAKKDRRNELREQVATEWRDRFGFGTRPGCDRPLPWPDDAATRWMALFEYIEECSLVWIPERVKRVFAETRSSVAAWEALIEQVSKDERDYAGLFRDSVSLGGVRGWPELFSLMVQGEGDFHWAVAIAQRGEEDPPVHGLDLDYDTGRFKPVKPHISPLCQCFGRVTDFARAMLETYAPQLSRKGRFVYPSRSPDKPHRGWSEPLGPQPTCATLKTSRYKLGAKKKAAAGAGEATPRRRGA